MSKQHCPRRSHPLFCVAFPSEGHLRRRANSHRPRRRHRFPRGREEATEGKDFGAGEEPGAASRATGDDPPRRAPKHDRDAAAALPSGERRAKKNAPCRRARRKPALLTEAHSAWRRPQTKAGATRAHRWIPTHLWHAKRFHVSSPLFSWAVPLVHADRGARASLRLASSSSSPKCTVQDATWEVNGCAIALEASRANASEQVTRSPSDMIVGMLQRLCGSDAPFLQDDAVMAGQQAGEGVIHEADAHPLCPLGPATFIFASTSEGGRVHTRLSILIHPALHGRVYSLLATMIPEDLQPEHEIKLSTAPLVLLRIRGRASTPTLRKVLKQADHADLSDDCDFNHCTMLKVRAPSSLIDPNLDARKENHTAIAHPSSILLKAHRPNKSYQHLAHNLASSGWDVLCHVSIGSSLFQNFVRDGGACAIGLIEDARARTEGFPPLPVFPRDYPDTAEGRAYWEGGTGMSASQKEGREDDWAVVRACLEGPSGRVNGLLKKALRSRKRAGSRGKDAVREDVAERTLISMGGVFGRDATPDSTETTSMIVVRGPFGIPFIKLLHGCGRLGQVSPGSNPANNACRRKPRRRVRAPTVSVRASPLTKQDAAAHSALCRQLKSSLLWPVLLRCELHCEGRGTLHTGDLVFPATAHGKIVNVDAEIEKGASAVHDGPRASPLGVVVTGGFSPCRGRCHGIGFISAERFIDSLDGTTEGVGVTIPHSNGQKMMALKVLIADTSGIRCKRNAVLSILL